MTSRPRPMQMAMLAAMIVGCCSAPETVAGQKINSATAVLLPAGCADMEEILIGTKGEYILMTAICNSRPEAWVRSTKESSNSASGPFVDHLTPRQLSQFEQFSAGPYCYRNGMPIQWVAIYEWRGRKRISGTGGGIRQAWIVNMTNGRFEPAPGSLIRSVECIAGEDE